MRLLGENKLAIRAKISPLIMPADAFATVFVSLEESSSHRLSCKKNSFVHKIFFFFFNSSSRSLITQIRCLFLVWPVVETMVVLPKIVPNTFPWQTDDAYFGVNYVVANDFPHPTPQVGMLSQAQKNLNLD